ALPPSNPPVSNQDWRSCCRRDRTIDSPTRKLLRKRQSADGKYIELNKGCLLRARGSACLFLSNLIHILNVARRVDAYRQPIAVP
ncbi:hypothetical protein, partial [Candidatus Mycobacterium methanotrophicum]|uniref:hypothetical protein n=1 Tax=Candidatus Mycobacterium methanotrophicum TaxID=2943498 RepID=UPI00358DBD66